MAIQRTLSIIKPDAAVDATQVDAICERLEANFKVIAAKGKKEAYRLTLEEAKAFYKEHQGKPFFDGLIETMTQGPVVIQVLEGENVIQRYRELMGPTDPQKAPAGTLRAEFGGKELPRNAVHGSDSPEGAEREIAFFFQTLP